MPKKLADDLNDRIVAKLSLHQEGVGIDDLHAALADVVSRRTLQRRLGELAGQITATGQGRARVYRAMDGIDRYRSNAGIGSSVMVARSPEVESYVPISPESEEVLHYLRRPIQQRKPVGYERAFLEAYRPNETWYLPPEIREHLLHIGRSPGGARPAGTYVRDLLSRLLIDLSWASSRLEGNTYTLLDTQNLIELGRLAEGKDRRDAHMILNHKAAIEMLVDEAGDIGFNTFTIFNLHALLSDNLLADPQESGRLRRRIVEIGGSVFHPLGIPQQIDQYFRMILDKAGAIGDPFEQAFFVMVHIPYLQPFIDVNKRVSRLGANIPLIQRNLCPLSFIDVPDRAYVEGTLGVYELGRVELLRDVFVWAYERSCRRYQAVRDIAADPDPERLRYREALIAVVSGIVRGQRPITEAGVRSLAESLVPPPDLARVIEMSLADLHNLHEGNVSRYRLRLSEYQAWHPLQRAQ